jgi:putative NIF3 family GTP cyclohydrolase 1 type 2
MTIQEIYELGIQMAIKADPRGETLVKKLLKKANDDYKELSTKKKRFFDIETLTNPYSDSRIYTGDLKTKVKKILTGIDASAAEVLLFDRLNEKGMGFDLFITHHPEGMGLTGLNDVMSLQVDVYGELGVPLNVSDSLMTERMGEVARKIHPGNYNQVIDAAKLLEVPLMSLHTVWDNLGNQFMTNYLKDKNFDSVGEILDYMLELPEYVASSKDKAGPIIISGSEKSRAGKVAIFFTGGTNPSKEMYIEMAKAGVGTIVDMHMPEEAVKEMKKHHVNVINAGHMSSDSLGANLFYDKLEAEGIEIVACSGLIRVKRKVKT